MSCEVIQKDFVIKIKEILTQANNGQTQVVFYYWHKNTKVKIVSAKTWRINLSEDLFNQLNSTSGVHSVTAEF